MVTATVPIVPSRQLDHQAAGGRSNHYQAYGGSARIGQPAAGPDARLVGSHAVTTCVPGGGPATAHSAPLAAPQFARSRLIKEAPPDVYGSVGVRLWSTSPAACVPVAEVRVHSFGADRPPLPTLPGGVQLLRGRRRAVDGTPRPSQKPSSGYHVVMGIGVGILLIAVGAILTFAGHATVAGLDTQVVGWVLMLTGVTGLGLFFVFWNRGRAMHPVAAQHWVYDDTTRPTPTTSARRYTSTPGPVPQPAGVQRPRGAGNAPLGGSGRHLVDNWSDRADPTWLLEWFEQ